MVLFVFGRLLQGGGAALARLRGCLRPVKWSGGHRGSGLSGPLGLEGVWSAVYAFLEGSSPRGRLVSPRVSCMLFLNLAFAGAKGWWWFVFKRSRYLEFRGKTVTSSDSNRAGP
jgi:hypothetical protein